MYRLVLKVIMSCSCVMFIDSCCQASERLLKTAKAVATDSSKAIGTENGAMLDSRPLGKQPRCVGKQLERSSVMLADECAAISMQPVVVISTASMQHSETKG